HYDEFPYVFAVSKFCNEEAVNLVSKIVDLKTANLQNEICNENFCLEAFYNQIYMNDCKLFYPILENLWLTHKILSFDILDNYEENHSKEQTADFILSGLQLSGKSELISQNMYDLEKMINQNPEEDLTFDEVGKLIKLVNKLKNLSGEKYLEAVPNVIKEIDDLYVDEFIHRLSDNKSLLVHKESFVEKMKNNESAFGLLVMMNGIKELGDENRFIYCFEGINKRRNEFSKYEIWQKRLQEFLKENNLKL